MEQKQAKDTNMTSKKNNSDPKEKIVHLDDLLSKFGAFGSYQLQAMTLLGITFFVNGMHCINFIFVAEEDPYRCKIDKCESDNAPFTNTWYQLAAPSEYRNCYKYPVTNNSDCSIEGFNRTNLEPCFEWVYQTENSFVSEFNLACQDWKRTFVGTAHSIGLMIGLLIQGQLSDWLGRKTTIIFAGVSASILGVAKSFSNSYILFIILELLEATFGDNCSPAYIMSVELVDADHRLQQQIYLSVLYAIGSIILCATAYYIRYWRHFIIAIYAPSILFIFYYFFMDESVRWLLSKGKKKEAIAILTKMMKQNKTEMNEMLLQNVECEEERVEKKSALKETLASKVMFRRFLICLVWWISSTFICFGLLINTVSLAGNKYLNFAIMCLADIPVSFLMVYVLKRFRRKKPLITSFVLAGIVCILQSFVPLDYVMLSTSLYFVGKFISTFTFATVYMYTSELFPTYSRNSMHALCSSIGRVGSVLAPLTPLLMKYSANLPTLLIGFISLFAGVITLLVPDVANDALPDNVTQAELIGHCRISNVGMTEVKLKLNDRNKVAV